MTGTGFAPRRRRDLDTFGAALGSAFIAGGLSVAAPFLLSLTATLVALAFAGWCSGLGRVGPRLGSLARPGILFSLAIAATGALLVVLPDPVPVARGLILPTSLLPLWAVRRPPVPAATPEETPP